MAAENYTIGRFYREYEIGIDNKIRKQNKTSLNTFLKIYKYAFVLRLMQHNTLFSPKLKDVMWDVTNSTVALQDICTVA